MTDEQQLVKAYKTFFSSNEGKIILKHLLRISNFMQTSYTTGDEATTIFNEGKRSILLEMLKKIEMPEIGMLDQIRNLKDI